MPPDTVHASSAATATTPPLLEVEGLNIHFATASGPFHAVRDLGFSMGREKVGIVGESGSGKSLTGRALLRLLPPAARTDARRLTFDGLDLRTLPEPAMRALRGRRMAMVMQDPRYALNPVMTVGAQIAESCRVAGVARRHTRKAVLDLLASVHIRDPERVYGLYPHEVSGGMGQRVMIAMMLAAGPDLLIADEPTSALDVTVQLQVLAILDELVTQRGMGLLFISHDLELVSRFCDRILVMYRGRIVDQCRASALSRSTHPYTQGLLASMPRVDQPRDWLPVLTRDPRWLEA